MGKTNLFIQTDKWYTFKEPDAVYAKSLFIMLCGMFVNKLGLQLKYLKEIDDNFPHIRYLCLCKSARGDFYYLRRRSTDTLETTSWVFHIPADKDVNARFDYDNGKHLYVDNLQIIQTQKSLEVKTMNNCACNQAPQTPVENQGPLTDIFVLVHKQYERIRKSLQEQCDANFKKIEDGSAIFKLLESPFRFIDKTLPTYDGGKLIKNIRNLICQDIHALFTEQEREAYCQVLNNYEAALETTHLREDECIALLKTTSNMNEVQEILLRYGVLSLTPEVTELYSIDATGHVVDETKKEDK